MKKHFCFLKEDEEKTYRYLIKFIEFFQKNEPVNKIMTVGNRIQIEELEKHCQINNIKEENKNNERRKWIDNKHGKEFREYLNSITITAIMLYSENDWSYENFIKKRKFFNKNKELFEYLMEG